MMNQITTSEDNTSVKNWEKLEPILEHLKDVNLAILKGRLERGMWLKRIKIENKEIENILKRKVQIEEHKAYSMAIRKIFNKS